MDRLRRLMILAVIALFSLAGCASGSASPKPEKFASVPSPVMDLAFSPDGTFLAAATLRHGASIWRVDGGTLHLSVDTGRVQTLAFTPDGQLLITAGGDQDWGASKVSIWQVSDGALVRTLDPALTAWAYGLAVDPAGELVAVATSDQVQLFKLSDGSLVRSHPVPGVGLAFSPDGRQLVVGDADPIVHVFDVQTGQELHTLAGHGLDVAYAADGAWFASPGWSDSGMVAPAQPVPTLEAGGEEVIQLWRPDGTPLRALRGHSAQIHGLASGPDGTRLASVTANDKSLRLWNTTDGTEIARATFSSNEQVDTVAFAPDGKRIAAGGFMTIYLWTPEGQ